MNDKIMLVPKGEFTHESGVQSIDGDALSRMVRAIKATGRDIPVDYGHGSFSSPDAAAAGWVVVSSVEERSDGLWGRIDWTPAARGAIEKREYRYLSPVFTFNPALSRNGKLHIERVVSFGLTNHPNIPAMRPLFNKQPLEEKMDEILSELLEVLGLPDGTGPATAIEKVKETASMLDRLAAAIEGLRGALGLPESASIEETFGSAVNSIRDMSKQDSATLGDVAALKEEIASLKRKELEKSIDDAVVSGKLLPAQKEWAAKYASTDPDGFNSFLANSSTVVRMGEMVIPGNAGNRAASIGPLQEKINGLLGISRESFDRYNS